MIYRVICKVRDAQGLVHDVIVVDGDPAPCRDERLPVKRVPLRTPLTCLVCAGWDGETL